MLAYSVEHLRTLGLFSRTAASFKHLNSRRKLCEPYNFRSLVTKFFKIGELWDGVGGGRGDGGESKCWPPWLVDVEKLSNHTS